MGDRFAEREERGYDRGGYDRGGDDRGGARGGGFKRRKVCRFCTEKRCKD